VLAYQRSFWDAFCLAFRKCLAC